MKLVKLCNFVTKKLLDKKYIFEAKYFQLIASIIDSIFEKVPINFIPKLQNKI